MYTLTVKASLYLKTSITKQFLFQFIEFTSSPLVISNVLMQQQFHRCCKSNRIAVFNSQPFKISIRSTYYISGVET